MNALSEDQIKANISYRQLLAKLWPYSKGSRNYFYGSLFSIALLSASSRLLPYLIGKAIDEGILKNDRQQLINIALLFLSVEVIKSFSQWVYLFLFQQFGNRVLYNLRADLLRHLENLPLEYFNKVPVGRIVTRITNDISNLGDLFTDGVITVFTELIGMLAILLSMSLISWKLTVVTMFFAPFFIWLCLKLSDRVRDLLRASKKKLSLINSFVAENLNGIKVIQIYNRVPRNQRKFLRLSNEYRELNLSLIGAYALLVPVINFFTAVTVAMALYAGGLYTLNDSIAIGSMVAFLMHVQDFIPPLREILEKYQQFQNSLTSAERVFQLFDEVPEQPRVTELTTFPAGPGQIEIRNLSFRYRPELELVLHKINLTIEAGKSTALIGRTGSGKSTFISLLQRFYDAPLNSIFLDQVAIERIDRQQLRQKIGVVLQDNFIFRGTIRQNISLDDDRISETAILQACARVGYLEILSHSGRTLDSAIEERGANLSVGERQLLGFARILAFAPDILILDEATANVDSQTESLIHRATQEVIHGRTSLIIAHRLSTIRQCDKIVVLDQGRVLEQGSHYQLLALKGAYWQLIHSHHENELI